MSARPGGAAGAIAIIVLALWIGAAVYFSAIVAPAAFRVLPTRTLAGTLVASTLPAIFVSGMVAGVVVSVLGAAPRRGIETAGALIAACCAIARFAIVPRIDRLRASLPVPLESLPPTDPGRVLFGRLHAASVVLLGVAIVLAIVALAAAARGLTAIPPAHD